MELSVRCTPVTGELPDPIVEAELLQARAEAARRLSVPVAQVAEPLAVRYDRPSSLSASCWPKPFATIPGRISVSSMPVNYLGICQPAR
ncbi:hypothetical protein L5D93_20025 [Paenibacillus thiaminolyticus]|nr:hypothetical protein [Paenibacillus thiaminolyticus]